MKNISYVYYIWSNLLLILNEMDYFFADWVEGLSLLTV